MKQYSQIIVPFKRVSDAPMELDYKFGTVEDLKTWASENLPILHAGLLKIVENPSSKKIDFYTFQEIPNESSSAIEAKNFEIVKLLSTDDINSVETEIGEIIDQITAIWGVQDPSNIDENYNSIKKIAERINYINEQIAKIKVLHQTDKAIAGYAGDDVMEYLTTLKYGSLTALSKELDSFLHSSSEEGGDIKTWEDLRNFLTGYKNNKSLKEVIDEITGGALKFEDTDTVGFERLELKDGVQIKANVKLGTGVDDTDLNIRNDNMLIVKNGGLFYNMQVRDTGKALRFIVNGSIIHIFEYEDVYKNAFGVADVKYDSSTNSIVIVFNNGDKLSIPFSLVFHGVDVENTAGSGVILKIEKSGDKGNDIIKARAEISNEANNGLMLKDDGLYASNDSNSITYGDMSVAHAIDALKASDEEILKKIEESSADAVKDLQQAVKDLQQADKDIQTGIDNAYKDLSGKITETNQTLASDVVSLTGIINSTKEELSELIATNKAELDAKDIEIATNLQTAYEQLQAKDAEIETKLTEEAGNIRNEFNTSLNDTNTAFAAADTELSKKIDDTKAALESLINDINKAYQAADESIREELAKQVEQLKVEINEGISQLRTDIDASLAQLRADVSNEISTKIKEAIDAHVQENHTFVEASENVEQE